MPDDDIQQLKEELGESFLGFLLHGFGSELTEPHKIILGAICELFLANEQVNMSAVIKQLEYRKQLAAIGGAGTIYRLYEEFEQDMRDFRNGKYDE